MTNQSSDSRPDPDALLAASLQAHRETLLRAIRNQRIRMRVSLAISACIALFAVVSYGIHDLAAAKLCAAIAVVSFVFNWIAGTSARKQLLDALQALDSQSP
jgi:O-antigen/teichoic acid export membrane protein